MTAILLTPLHRLAPAHRACLLDLGPSRPKPIPNLDLTTQGL
jgi:hypothetical protein